VAAALLAAAGAGVRADDELLYYRTETGEIVFTNTPNERSEPVPGFQRVEPFGAEATLPATPFDPYIDVVAAEAGLSPVLIKAVALVESGFDARAISPKGAQGLMQLMPGTAAQYGVADAFDPLQNLRAGATHLRGLLDEFGGDLTLALAAYNAGSNAVRRHGGVPDYRETRDYVRKVHESLGRDAPRLPGPSAPVDRVPVRMVRQADGSVLLLN
jgi:soluble lytic murein transglycosylase-like protein